MKIGSASFDSKIMIGLWVIVHAAIFIKVVSSVHEIQCETGKEYGWSIVGGFVVFFLMLEGPLFLYTKFKSKEKRDEDTQRSSRMWDWK